MSYCRWSSDNWKSDVYVYADVNGGWTTHVAGRKKAGLDSLPPNPMLLIGKVSPDDWNIAYKAHNEAYDKLEFVNIELPHAGKTFRNATAQECANTLRMLKGLGYHVPNGVIEELESEDSDELKEVGHG